MSKIKDFEVSGLPEGTFAEVVCRERGDAEIYTVNVGKKGGEKPRLSVFYFSKRMNSKVKSQTCCTVGMSSFSSGVCTPRRVGP